MADRNARMSTTGMWVLIIIFGLGVIASQVTAAIAVSNASDAKDQVVAEATERAHANKDAIVKSCEIFKTQLHDLADVPATMFDPGIVTRIQDPAVTELLAAVAAQSASRNTDTLTRINSIDCQKLVEANH